MKVERWRRESGKVGTCKWKGGDVKVERWRGESGKVET